MTVRLKDIWFQRLITFHVRDISNLFPCSSCFSFSTDTKNYAFGGYFRFKETHICKRKTSGQNWLQGRRRIMVVVLEDEEFRAITAFCFLCYNVAWNDIPFIFCPNDIEILSVFKVGPFYRVLTKISHFCLFWDWPIPFSLIPKGHGQKWLTFSF